MFFKEQTEFNKFDKKEFYNCIFKEIIKNKKVYIKINKRWKNQWDILAEKQEFVKLILLLNEWIINKNVNIFDLVYYINFYSNIIV